MKDKLDIILGIGIATCVVGTLAFYVLNVKIIELDDIVSIGIALILVVSAVYILWDRVKNIKKGLPAQDERLKLTNYKACSYGFIASIWSSVFAPLISGIFFDYELPGHYVTAIVVLCGGLSFMISYLFLAWNGNLE
jgi:divalent metal cation (Fe/Co/Zn/Cd) transporter